MEITCVVLCESRPRHHVPVECVALDQSDDTVGDIHDAIVHSLSSAGSTSGSSSDNSSTLVLYLAKRPSPSLNGQVAWLQRTHLPLLDAELVRDGYERLDELKRPLCDEDLFGRDFCGQTNDGNIHVVAWRVAQGDTEDSDHGSPRKRARNEVVHSVVTHPRLVLHKYCVPLNTIPAFEATRRALATGNTKPIVLLYGPLFCGKSTILLGVWEWIRKRRGGRCLLVELKPSLGNGSKDERALWKALGQSMRAQVDSKAAFMELVATIDEPWYLLGDNLHFVLETQPVVVSQFFDVLCELRALPQFGGFVGVGSSDLQSLVASGDRLAHISDFIEVTPFSKSQMAVCFGQMMGDFDESLQERIMEYCGGSAGVFGSLVEFTAVSYKTDLSGNEWMQWFETMGFAKYVSLNNVRLSDLSTEWQKLMGLVWHDLVVSLDKKHRAHAPLRPRIDVQGDVEQLEQEIRRLRETEAVDGLDMITRRIRVLYLSIIAESWRRKKFQVLELSPPPLATAAIGKRCCTQHFRLEVRLQQNKTTKK